jgi:hypothetical protein
VRRFQRCGFARWSFTLWAAGTVRTLAAIQSPAAGSAAGLVEASRGRRYAARAVGQAHRGAPARTVMSAAPAPRETLAQILDRVAAVVAAVVPGLDAGDARLLVAEAASRRGALRHLDRHLAAFPCALASGSADAPKAVIALAGLLAAAGYPGIGVAACLACGGSGELPHRSGDGRLCRNCYRSQRQEPCRQCGRTRPVHARTAAGPLCTTCSSHLRPARTCGACGQDGPVRAWRPDGSAVCETCYRAPERPCARCGRLAVTRALLPEGAVCRSCRGEPHLAERARAGTPAPRKTARRE